MTYRSNLTPVIERHIRAKAGEPMVSGSVAIDAKINNCPDECDIRVRRHALEPLSGSYHISEFSLDLLSHDPERIR